MDESPRPALRVLVVDECPEARETLCLLLRLWEHEARDAADGTAALEVARTFHPEVALVQFAGPGLDGCAVLQRLRALPGLSALKAVALTGLRERPKEECFRAAGFLCAVAKPVQLDRLERLVMALAASRRP